MPAATLADLGLEGKSFTDLEALRLGIQTKLRTEFKGYDDPEVPIDLLNQLAVVTQALRRKNAGPPKPEKKAKASKGASKATTDDLLI